jgi:O-antigen/teichoic acid export membrane protein
LIAENRTAVAAKLAFAVNVFTQITVIVVAVLSRSPETVWVSRIVAMAVGELLTLLFLDRDLRSSVVRLRHTVRLPPEFVAFSRSLWVAGVLAAVVYSRSEIFVMRLAGQKVRAGIFALAFGISYQITAPVDSLLGPLLPASAALVAAHPERARDALLRGLRFSSLLSGLVFASLVPATYFAIPRIYGSSFRGVAVPFVFLAWISATQSVSHPIGALITGRRGGKVLARANFIAVVADLALAVALIPKFGILGAVVANAVGQGVSLAILAVDEKRHQGMGARELLGAMQAWIRAPLATAAAIAVGHTVGDRLFFGADVIVALAIGTLGYIALLRFRFRPLTDSDQDALLRSVPRGMQRGAGLLVRVVSTNLAAA